VGIVNDKEQAKKMYYDYDCNFSNMYRDGVSEEYRKFGVTKEEEIEWRREYVSYWTNQLSQEDFTALGKLEWAWAYEALPILIEMADKGDGYAKLQFANTLFTLGLGGNCLPIQEKALKKAIQLWKSLVHRPIELSDRHKSEVYSNMRMWGASTPEEYVRMFAKQQLDVARIKGELL
jgi:hypothetical protein